ncbi:catalase-like [Uloborus diversus]|uniref:catalase-like n=1 Tax=Uloborus diversus TaxID=327109 RepID=UPI00240985D7|nr:catalase-like [Uloborus diversus]
MMQVRFVFLEEEENVFGNGNFMTDQGIRNLTSEEATRLAGVDPDFQGRDLFEAIERGDYPSWTLYIQVMTEDEVKNFRINPFDATKEWPQDEFPLIRVGKLVLNENPINYFAEIEQLAFCPVRLVPGIEPSPDKLLQGRLFAYTDTQRYRLGVNFNQIPVNIPSKSPARNYERNGFANVNGNQGPGPHYYPNSYGGPQEHPVYLETPFEVCGTATRYNSSDDDNFTQARIFYEQMNEDQKGRLIQNIVDSLSQAQEFIQQRQLNNFRQASEDFADRLTAGLTAKKQGVMMQEASDQEEANFSFDEEFDFGIGEGYGGGVESVGRTEFLGQTKFGGNEEVKQQTAFNGQRLLVKNIRV